MGYDIFVHTHLVADKSISEIHEDAVKIDKQRWAGGLAPLTPGKYRRLGAKYNFHVGYSLVSDWFEQFEAMVRRISPSERRPPFDEFLTNGGEGDAFGSIVAKSLAADFARYQPLADAQPSEEFRENL